MWEWCPTHPQATNGVYLQHRMVMEVHLGRYLTRKERVHHRNHLRTDNRLENLELIASHSQHMRDHWQNKGRRCPDLIERVREIAGRPDVPMSTLGITGTTLKTLLDENPDIEWLHRKNWRAQRLTEKKVREALQGRTVLEAAKILAVHPQTLYNRFDHLLTKRASPGSLDPHREMIWRMRFVERVSMEDIAAQYRVSRVTVLKSLQRWRKEDAKLAAIAVPQDFRAKKRKQ